MKGLSLTGLLLLALAFVLFYFNDSFSVIKLFEPITLMGILAGIGIGLFIGGLIGYVSKGNAMKEAKIRQELKQLQEEKAAFEKQKQDNDLANKSF
ncbi:MAG: hypothetical protein DI529_14605 [Chryseobacterium sp.]|nr:MAG: hypothetical protein DI529_14605 [Chryseobacterium sp.]